MSVFTPCLTVNRTSNIHLSNCVLHEAGILIYCQRGVTASSKVCSKTKELWNICKHTDTVLDDMSIWQLVSSQTVRQSMKATESSTRHRTDLVTVPKTVSDDVRRRQSSHSKSKRANADKTIMESVAEYECSTHTQAHTHKFLWYWRSSTFVQ